MVPDKYDFAAGPSIKRLPITSPDAKWHQRFLAACKRPAYEFTADYFFLLPDGHIGKIPCGFRTDFASIPRVLFFIPGLSPTGVLMRGSIPHDFGYRHNKLLNPAGEWTHKQLGRKALDRIMRDINLRDEGAMVPAYVAFWVLSLVGCFAFHKQRRADTGRLNLYGDY